MKGDSFLYIGKLNEAQTNYSLMEIPAFILLGTIAGLVGSLYVYTQKLASGLRKK